MPEQQVPPQLVWPLGQQTPPEQLPEQQSLFALQEPLLTQQVVPEQVPPAGQVTQVPPQLVKPVLQVMPQTPAVQVACPFVGTGQTLPQLPQLLVSLLVSRQVPEQLVKPDGQHCPLVQLPEQQSLG